MRAGKKGRKTRLRMMIIIKLLDLRVCVWREEELRSRDKFEADLEMFSCV
jgi:hypothetical protein